ncbi:MAG: NAD(P)-dependent alcohol dehydrogenase [Gemmatimonadota bacterium]|jgi:NADPH:quinone reductase-like Zn-dependent oxidoreductase
MRVPSFSAVSPSTTGWAPLVLLFGILPGSVSAQSGTIRQWQYVASSTGRGCELEMVEVGRPEPGPGEIQVRIHATSLNGRDRYALLGRCGPGGEGGQVALSDGAGEVIAVGPGATRFQVGDRVVGTYFAEGFLEGRRPPGAMDFLRGGPNIGMLSEIVVDDERGFVRMPDYMTYEEAATLPIAAVTAYVALFKYGRFEPNDYVLLEGTGGVSSFGLLFAAAAGGHPIITSSSDEKLERARQLGAVGTVNYRQNPDWEEEVRELSGGIGVQHVLDIGGEETRLKALEALGNGGHMALIGGLTGFGGAIPVGDIFNKDASVTAYHTGSRADFEEMNRFLEGHGIHPVIDRVFEFEEADEAFDFFENGDYMGKLVIRIQ